jgi:hypothetical protein
MIRLPVLNSEKSRACWWQYLFFSQRVLHNKKRLTMRARGRLDSHRQNGFFRGFGFFPFHERVSSLQPPVTRAVRRSHDEEKVWLQL